MIRSTRSSTSAAESRPTNTRMGSATAASPMTSVISSRVSTMLTNRRPSRDRVSNGTTLCGPPDTIGDVGGDWYAGSTAAPPCSTRRTAYSYPAYRPAPSIVRATAWPMGLETASYRGANREMAFDTPKAIALSPDWRPITPAPTPTAMPTEFSVDTFSMVRSPASLAVLCVRWMRQAE